MKETLAELQTGLQAVHPYLEDLIRPSRSPAEVRAVLTGHLGAAPEELVEWFCWQDGMTNERADGLVSFWSPVSLAEALSWWSYPWWPRTQLRLFGRRGHYGHMSAEFAPDADATVMWGNSHKDLPDRLTESLEEILCLWVRGLAYMEWVEDCQLLLPRDRDLGYERTVPWDIQMSWFGSRPNAG